MISTRILSVKEKPPSIGRPPNVFARRANSPVQAVKQGRPVIVSGPGEETQSAA